MSHSDPEKVTPTGVDMCPGLNRAFGGKQAFGHSRVSPQLLPLLQ
jgi:hypothetical protein